MTTKEYPIDKENLVHEITITHNNQFVIQQNKLKEFSNKLPNSIDLPIAENSSWLSWFGGDDVTSADVNKLAETIQDRMIKQNEYIKNIIQEFGTVYATFSSLDKVYLQEIIQSFNAAVEANKKANKNMQALNKQHNEIQENQQDIGRIVAQQKQMIDVLKSFKEKLEKLRHLIDVDSIFANVRENQNNITLLIKTTNKLGGNIDQLSKNLNERLIKSHKEIDQQIAAIYKKIQIETDEKIEVIFNELKIAAKTITWN